MKKGQKPNYNLETIRESVINGISLNELAKAYNVCPSSMGRFLRKQGVNYNLQVRRISKNHDFFENINSEIKAYLLGFFVADGCIYNKSRFGILLRESDKEIVELFKKYIAPDSYIKKLNNIKGAKNREPQVFLRISSKKIVSDLNKLGITDRKTYKPISIPNVPDSLKWHFIRGYFDGDGHVGMKKVRNNRYIRVSFSNGDGNILKEIQNFTNGGALRNHNTYFTLEYENRKDCNYLLENMYKNANFYLKRKYNRYNFVNTEVITSNKRLVTP